jgi:hypothetical protein
MHAPCRRTFICNMLIRRNLAVGDGRTPQNHLSVAVIDIRKKVDSLPSTQPIAGPRPHTCFGDRR